VPVEKTDAAKPGDAGAAKPGETVVLAFVGAAPTVRIEWTPKAEGATGMEALASVEGEQQVWVNEGVTRTQARLAYAISRAKLPALSIEVPADQKVVNVFDANVRQWSVEKSGDAQKITVQLFEPAAGSQQVTVELEKFADQGNQKDVRVPVVKALGVGRQQGVVVVQVAQGLKAEATQRAGLLQVDAAELPPSLARAKWDFSYRYATVPFELTLAVEKVEPRILVDSLVEAELQPERLTLRLSALYTVERAGVFRLELDVPEGYEVRRVAGCAIAGSAEAQVDTHHLTGEKKTRLVVNLARKALGRVGLAVDLERELHEADLLAPTGKAAKIPLVLPRIAPGTVQHDVGRLVVYAPPSLRVNPEGDKALRAISVKEALEGMTARGGKGSDLQQILAYAFTQEPTSLALSAERRKPQVTIGQLLVARIEDDAVKYEATFFYDILYSGVKSLRIDVPTAIAQRLRNKTPGVREKVIEPAPEDVTPGCQAWSFSGETELVGKGRINLVWEEKIEKLGIGQSVPLVVPRLVPTKADQAKVDRSWGQIVIVKAETIDIHPSGEPKGLRPIDPQHDLMPGASVQGAAGAFEFHDDWALTLTATRYELEDVKRTSIERAVARMVVTRADQVSVQALYRMRSAQQRLEIKLPEDVRFDAEPLRINGRPVTLERGKEGKFFVPLAGTSPDAPFVLELRYTVPGDGGTLELPEFPEEPAVLKVYLCAYLPDELALLAKSGPWTDEIRWRADGTWNWWRPDAELSDPELIAWVREGVNVTDTSDTFETDGRRYVFSTLRPVGPLGLVKMSEELLTGVLLALIVVGGLLLVPARAPLRALAVGVLVIALILSGVFLPIFARQVLDGYLLAALTVVAVLWAIRYFAGRKPPRSATPAPPGTPFSPTPPETMQASPATDAAKTENDSTGGGKSNG
jgi:hypothetical protein